MNRIDIRSSIKPQRNASLVAHHDHSHSLAVQSRNSCGHSRQHVEFLMAGDVSSLRHLLVENSVAIEENRPYVGKPVLSHTCVGRMIHGICSVLRSQCIPEDLRPLVEPTV